MTVTKVWQVQLRYSFPGITSDEVEIKFQHIDEVHEAFLAKIGPDNYVESEMMTTGSTAQAITSVIVYFNIFETAESYHTLMVNSIQDQGGVIIN